MKRALITLVALVGCGLNDGDGSPSCSEVFADGASPPAHDDLVPCRAQDGEDTLVAIATVDYGDGCVAYITDYGWWVDGQSVTAGTTPGALDIQANC